MANSNPASMCGTAPASPHSVWFGNANTGPPGANGNFTFDRGQRSSASMSHSQFQGFSPRNGHGRTRSTSTVPRSSWFGDSNPANPATGPGPVLPASDYASDLAAGHSYCLDRGNGEFTRLIPADLLPALNEVPARETIPHGMVILPPLGTQMSNRYLAAQNECVTFQKPQKQIDSIVSAGPSNRRNKIYCDKWVHEGVCAFTQQGCKFKHEMPFDEATQRSLGLFQGFPAWWKKKNEEQVIETSQQMRILSPNQLKFSPVNETAAQMTETLDRAAHSPIAYSGLQGRTRTGARSQWMKNGIVPFFKRPIASLPQLSQCSSSVSQQRTSVQGEFNEASMGQFQGGPQR